MKGLDVTAWLLPHGERGQVAAGALGTQRVKVGTALVSGHISGVPETRQTEGPFTQVVSFRSPGGARSLCSYLPTARAAHKSHLPTLRRQLLSMSSLTCILLEDSCLAGCWIRGGCPKNEQRKMVICKKKSRRWVIVELLAFLLPS